MAPPRTLTLLATTLLLSLGALTNGEQLELSEAELRAYDGTDPDKPIYLAIDGTVFDVSAAPAFYGPGGHYHHFVGRDATRAWVTECWDTPDQLTWRMDGIEAMFAPKWLDELIESAGTGEDESLGAINAMGKEQVAKMVARAAARFGTVTPEEKATRREEDAKEAAEGVTKALEHWKKFFADNPKYQAVGTVVLDKEGSLDPPPPCEAAMKKRPIRGGRLGNLAEQAGGIMGMAGGTPGGSGATGNENIPDFVKKMENDKKKAEKDEKKKAKKAKKVEEDDEDLVKDEL